MALTWQCPEEGYQVGLGGDDLSVRMLIKMRIGSQWYNQKQWLMISAG